jgi:uncharacterized coiled-coil protein SlyX
MTRDEIADKVANNRMLEAIARVFFGLSVFWGYVAGQGEAVAKVTERVSVIETRISLGQASRDQQNAVLTTQLQKLADNTNVKFDAILEKINALSNDVAGVNATLKLPR